MRLKWICRLSVCAWLLVGIVPRASSQQTPLDSKKLYNALKTFKLGGKRASANNLVIHVDRAELTFTSGIFYFSAAINGHIYAAVFIGDGTFRTEPPPNEFEKQNVKRLLNAPDVASDFKTAVLCFSDGSFETIRDKTTPADVPLSAEAQRLATNFDPDMLKEGGANIAGRLSISLLNHESPGIFIAQFDKGKRGKFTYVFDPQTRIPTSVFRLNGGEKGVIFRYNSLFCWNELWMAFLSEDDYAKGIVAYSDVNDQIAIRHHDMDMDLSNPGTWLKYTDRMDIEVLQDGVTAIQFALNENLSSREDLRRKDSLRLKFVNGPDGKPLDAIQEDWDCTLTVFLPAPAKRGDKMTLTMRLEGKHIATGASVNLCVFPLSDSWYPRHDAYQRSTYRLLINHSKHEATVAAGDYKGDQPSAQKGLIASEWVMDAPVPRISFGLGQYKKYDKPFKGEETAVPFDYYWIVSPNGTSKAPNNDFIAAEMSNNIQYFTLQFGEYPYHVLHGVYACGQTPSTAATMLILPGGAINYRFEYGFDARRLGFISQTVAEQWFGSEISIRSYRDEWMNNGFAKYFSLLYMGQRDKLHSLLDTIDTMHEFLRAAPGTQTGLGPGMVATIGPMIVGHRLNTLETKNGYYQVAVSKAALVVRMLHFLFTDPETLDDKPFFDMMKDFDARYRGQKASTEDFLAVANEHFQSTEIAKKYELAGLGWFFRQWVYNEALPSYRLEYHLEKQPDGSAMLKGTLFQDGLPENEKWFMPIPLAMTYGKDKVARGTIAVLGKETPVSVKVPMMPDKVELDPYMMVLSAKTSVKKVD
jgi:hypothetical protein